jgi:hypothetical protein
MELKDNLLKETFNRFLVRKGVFSLKDDSYTSDVLKNKINNVLFVP